jgi:hypothetical protein
MGEMCGRRATTLKWRHGVLVLQTDKASMLDEIIDYVKFLQLQVKVTMPLLNS